MKHPTRCRPRIASHACRLTLLAAVMAAAVSGCGKKGPPLPPLVRLPAAPEPFAARRLGGTVWLSVRIPSINADKSAPADLERVDVYAVSGRAATAETVFKYGSRIASIPVRKPASGAGESTARGRGEDVPPEDRPAPPPRPPASIENGFDQGDTAVVDERLGPEQLREVATARPAKAKTGEERQAPASAFGPPLPAPPPTLPVRVYVAVGVNHQGRKGAASPLQSVPLVEPEPAPPAPTLTYTETGITVTWTPPAGARPPLPATGLLEARPIGSLQAAGGYDVYEVAPPAPPRGGAERPAAPGGRMPAPLNATPLAGPPYVDDRMEFGAERCYVVRSVTIYGAEQVQSEASPRACVTPADTFPPAAPTGLRAVGGEKAISLIWDANREADLSGYLVLRAELPGGAFVQVTPEPIGETMFSDTAVTPGVRYAYEVVAVDKAKNRSAPSNRVEESAR